MRYSNFFLLILLPSIAACTIHPLTEDVTRDTTLDIVKKIRCEAADALNNISIKRLKEFGGHDYAKFLETGELDVQELFEKYGRSLPPRYQNMFANFVSTSVGFDFSFKITSDNDNSGEANFTLPITNGSFTLGIKTGKKLTRLNERTFIIVSDFLTLHNRSFHLNENSEPINCHNVKAKTTNHIYPITGEIGLEEVFDTYIRLEQLAGLSVHQDTKKFGDFSDALTFTTKITSSANPKVTLSPVTSRSFRLADASANFSGERNDVHKVTVALDRGKQFNYSDLKKFRAKQKIRSAINDSKRSVARILRRRRVEQFIETQK